MNVQKHFEEKLMRRVAKHAAAIRRHGRYPATPNALWPTLAALTFYGGIEFCFWLAGWWGRGHLFNAVLSASAFIAIAAINIRALFFGRIRTKLPIGESVQALQVTLAAAGYSLEWTPSHDAAVLFVAAGWGRLDRRHAVVFVPEDGRIWYNVHDPRGSRFFVAHRKPLRALISMLETSMGLPPQHRR